MREAHLDRRIELGYQRLRWDGIHAGHNGRVKQLAGQDPGLITHPDPTPLILRVKHTREERERERKWRFEIPSLPNRSIPASPIDRSICSSRNRRVFNHKRVWIL